MHIIIIMLIPLFKRIFFTGCLLGLAGCESVSFYYQAIEGQWEILSNREPIQELVEDSQTSSKVKQKLELVLSIREFAEEQLSLPVNEHYSQYTDLGRPYVVWNVFAAPEFSVEPKTWCFPIAGCVAYKGFFAEDNANQHAAKLSNQGFDVYVGGVAAFSTLGWFEDPVLNTFLRRSDASLAALMIHELAHQKLYVKGDSAFNESFATTVEILGLAQWLTAQGRANEIEVMAQHRQRKAQFVDLILQHRETLQQLYDSALDDTEKRRQKIQLTDQLRQNYQQLKATETWNGYQGYDKWFAGPLNNAQLSTIATYHHWVDSFMKIHQQVDGHWPSFYQRCRELAELNRDLRDQTLEKLSMEAANIRL